MKLFIFLSGAGLCWLGSFFIATQLFKRAWKDKVTYLKLLGFTVLFSASMAGMVTVMAMIADRYVYFGR